MSAPPLELSAAAFVGLRDLLHRWTGIFLAENKRHLVVNRLHRLVDALELSGYGDYLERLRERGPASDEARTFINCLTTNKTSFFREPGHFDFLREQVIGVARARAQAGHARQLRIWCAAASTGEEPYTLAMVVRAELPANETWDARILATDLDTDVLASARRGIYDDARLEAVPPALRQRFFRRCAADGQYQVDPELARMITFAQANLVADPFPVRGRFDVIFCRNVMIYFDRPTQIRLVNNLVSQLAPGGYLIVGHSESLIGFPVSLESAQVGVYRPTSAPSGASEVPSSPPVPDPPVRPRREAVPSPVVAPGRRPAVIRQPASAAPIDGLPRQRIVLGQWFSSQTPTVVTTLLGSCVAACLFDPVARIGGMNHFMLPDGDGARGRPARFGVHAMEVLINDLMAQGAQRDRIVAKVFGAGAVTPALSPTVSDGNAAFIRQFLTEECIPLLAERLGGRRPREVMLRTDTGEAFCRVLEPRMAAPLSQVELAAWRRTGQDQVSDQPVDPMSSVELF